MDRLYADENFPLPIVELLRIFGHDVLTTEETGNSRLGIPDEDVLEFAIADKRAVLTRNWNDFRQEILLKKGWQLIRVKGSHHHSQGQHHNCG